MNIIKRWAETALEGTKIISMVKERAVNSANERIEYEIIVSRAVYEADMAEAVGKQLLEIAKGARDAERALIAEEDKRSLEEAKQKAREAQERAEQERVKVMTPAMMEQEIQSRVAAVLGKPLARAGRPRKAV